MSKGGGRIRVLKASASSVAVRSAKPSEAEALTTIALRSKSSWGYPKEYLRLWKDELTVTDAYISAHVVCCAERAGTVVGFYSLTEIANGLELDFLYVSPDYMGQGIGRALLEHATAGARERGSETLRIVSDPHAEGFYTKHGALRVGMVPSKPEGREIPVLRLRL